MTRVRHLPLGVVQSMPSAPILGGGQNGTRAGGRYLRRVAAVPERDLGGGPAAGAVAGEMVFPAGASFGPRKQTAYEVILLHDGELVIEVDAPDSPNRGMSGEPEISDSRRVRLLPGDVTLLVPGPQCVFRFCRKAETRVSFVMTFDPALPLPLLELLEDSPIVLPASSAMTRLLDTVMALAEPVPSEAALRRPDLTIASSAPTKRLPSPPSKEGTVWTAASTIPLFVDIARAAGLVRLEPSGHEHPALAAAREVMRRRLSDRIRLRDLAEAAHVAPEHLVRLFRQRMGTTPMRYLWAARVRLGIHLLEHTDLPIAQIADRVGCQSPKHFTRLVCADVGAPPREVRRRAWSDGGG